jgi:hypothetical protein
MIKKYIVRNAEACLLLGDAATEAAHKNLRL